MQTPQALRFSQRRARNASDTRVTGDEAQRLPKDLIFVSSFRGRLDFRRTLCPARSAGSNPEQRLVIKPISRVERSKHTSVSGQNVLRMHRNGKGQGVSCCISA